MSQLTGSDVRKRRNQQHKRGEEINAYEIGTGTARGRKTQHATRAWVANRSLLASVRLLLSGWRNKTNIYCICIYIYMDPFAFRIASVGNIIVSTSLFKTEGHNMLLRHVYGWAG